MHSRATVLVTLALVISAGVFLSRPFARRDAALLFVVTLAGTTVSVAFCLHWPGYGAMRSSTALSRGALVLLTGALLLLWKWVDEERHPRWSRAAAAALVLVSLADLGMAVYGQKKGNREGAPSAEESAAQRALQAAGLLEAGQPPPRVFFPRFRENAGMEQGWSTPYGFSALALRRVWDHMHQVLDVRPPIGANTFPSYGITSYGPLPYNSMALVAGHTGRAGALVFNSKPDPRAYLATAARTVRDFGEATSLMRAGHDFHRVALVEEPSGLLDLPPAPPDLSDEQTATITTFAPERIIITASSKLPALLVLAEPWFPGWEAVVNGVATPCLPANGWMRAVRVPAGSSEVVMTFHSTYLRAGAVISVAALMIALGLLLTPLRGAKAGWLSRVGR